MDTTQLRVNVFAGSDRTVTFSGDISQGQIGIHTKFGKITFQVMSSGFSFPSQPIRFDQRANPPSKVTVSRISNTVTEIGVKNSPQKERRYSFFVSIQATDGTLYVSSDPTIVTMRPEGQQRRG